MSEGPSAGERRRDRKARYKAKLEELLGKYKNVLIVGVDNVGSYQMQKIRIALRGKAVVCLGKNTMMRMIIREQLAANPKLEGLLQYVRGNMGLCFTNEELRNVRDLITANKVPAAAKSGTVAPTDVFVPPGPTGLDPGQTNFFQALNIATKIARGSIEIVNTVHLIKAGEKVTSSAVALLSKLDIKPFYYGVIVTSVYENGAIYPVHILDVTQDELMAKFFNGVHKLAAIGLAVGYPTAATVPHSLASGWKKLVSVALAVDYEFKELKDMKSAKPAAATAAPAAAAAGAGGKKDDKKDAKKEDKHEEKPKEDEEEDDGLGGGMGGLFGD